METKRCAYCHKLQRADAQVCSRCGHVFVQKTSRPSQREWTQPSIPPASPHRAGHYSGLHPEDQPFQSNKIAVHHPLLQDNEKRRPGLPEPEHIVLPVTDPALRRRVPSRDPYNELSGVEFPIVEAPVFYERQKWHLPRPAIPVLLAISCIFFIIASSILAVVLIRKSSATTIAQLTTTPSLLRASDTLTLSGSRFPARSQVTFTYDDNKVLLSDKRQALETLVDGRGNFSLQLRVPNTWEPGQHSIHATSANLSVSTTITIEQPPEAPPALRLSTSNLSFGSDAPGVSSDRTILLINNGGGQITWHLDSDQPWLAASPGNGVFSGRESILVVVNRASLGPASYTGHITVTPDGNSSLSPVTVTVTMGVEAVSAVLAVSPSALPFSMVVGQQPVMKAIILQNSSSQALTWSASASTNDQGHWLSADPASGVLDAGVEGYMNAKVDVQGLAPGSYRGTLTFSSGPGNAIQQVIITLTVS